MAAVVLAALAAPYSVPRSLAAEAPPVTVFAAASMAPALTEIALRLEEEKGIEVRLVFASSGVLARQVANGAPADLFVSANRRWMDWLIERGLIDSAPVPLLGNRLVLVQPADAPETLALDDSLPERLGDDRLAIGDPDHVPAGIYAKEALESLGLWPQLQRSVVLLPNVRAALLLVERGEVAAGIVYRTDVNKKKVRVAAAFQPDSHSPIIYSAGVVAAGRTLAAWEVLSYLQRPGAQAVFRRYGFAVD